MRKLVIIDGSGYSGYARLGTYETDSSKPSHERGLKNAFCKDCASFTSKPYGWGQLCLTLNEAVQESMACSEWQEK